MNCKCIAEVNEKLKPHGVRIWDSHLAFTSDLDVRLVLKTEQVSGTKKKRTPLLFPEFCPFCGKKQGKKKEGSFAA